MRRNLAAFAAVIAIAACSSTPIPAASPNPSSSSSSPPIPSPIPSPSASPVAPPSQSPSVSVITEQVGLLTVTHPVAWRLVAGPKGIPGRPVPLFYLSDAPLTVGPCPTPDPTGGEFQGCPAPLAVLPSGGVLITVVPNLGLPARNPPEIGVSAATRPCRAIGGEAEM